MGRQTNEHTYTKPLDHQHSQVNLLEAKEINNKSTFENLFRPLLNYKSTSLWKMVKEEKTKTLTNQTLSSDGQHWTGEFTEPVT